MELLIGLALVATLAVPGRSNATPSIAADGQFVAIAWSAALPSGATDIFLAVSRDGGRTFGSPARVNDKDGDARVNGEQPPRVVVQHAVPPIITVVWTTKGASGTRLVSARSTDGGRSFARATTVPGGDAPGNRGWEAIAERQRSRTSSGWTIANSRNRNRTSPRRTINTAAEARMARGRTAWRWRSDRSCISPRSTGRRLRTR